MKVLQINVAVNTGSTGKIAENIGLALMHQQHESIIAYGRNSRKSASQTIKIGNSFDQALHGIKSRLADQHGFGSKKATEILVQQMVDLQPDIIHLHNLHGYYLNIDVLFRYLKTTNIAVVWTLHDCWAFTGHCSFFERVNCYKWKTECNKCPLSNKYPASFFVDNSTDNFYKKKELFNGLKNLTLVSPSNWLSHLLGESFLNNYPAKVIHNGINLNIFTKKSSEEYLKKKVLNSKFIILGVASIWDRRKGLADFIQLSSVIDKDDRILLVGLTKNLMKDLPENIIGIERTENIDELVSLYNLANVFVNPTWVDNFPTTNLESLACGTPVITYNTGGSIEAVDNRTGFVVQKGDIEALKLAIDMVRKNGKSSYAGYCRQRAETFFNEQDRLGDYIDLYTSLLEAPLVSFKEAI